MTDNPSGIKWDVSGTYKHLADIRSWNAGKNRWNYGAQHKILRDNGTDPLKVWWRTEGKEEIWYARTSEIEFKDSNVSDSTAIDNWYGETSYSPDNDAGASSLGVARIYLEDVSTLGSREEEGGLTKEEQQEIIDKSVDEFEYNWLSSSKNGRQVFSLDWIVPFDLLIDGETSYTDEANSAAGDYSNDVFPTDIEAGFGVDGYEFTGHIVRAGDDGAQTVKVEIEEPGGAIVGDGISVGFGDTDKYKSFTIDFRDIYYDKSDQEPFKIDIRLEKNDLTTDSYHLLTIDPSKTHYFYGTNEADTLLGLKGKDSLYGYSGSDRILGGDEDDLLEGGIGDDLLFGDQNLLTDEIRSTDGNDTINGGQGNDRIDGEGGNDELTGGQGKDRFYASLGQDKITDFYYAQKGGIFELNRDSLNPSYLGDKNPTPDDPDVDLYTYGYRPGSAERITGNDNALSVVLDIYRTKAIATYDNSDNFTGYELTEDSTPVSDSDSENFTTLTIVNAKDAIQNGALGDVIDGLEDDEKQQIVEKFFEADYANPENIEITTDENTERAAIVVNVINDTESKNGVIISPKILGITPENSRKLDISGGQNNDAITGGSDRDILKGNAGTDNLFGGAQADTLEGGSGDDTLNGGTGNDLMAGGGGKDTYRLSVGNDTISGYEAKADTITLPGTSTKREVKGDVNQSADYNIEGKIAFDLTYEIGEDQGKTTVITTSDFPTSGGGGDGGSGGGDGGSGGGETPVVQPDLPKPPEIEGGIDDAPGAPKPPEKPSEPEDGTIDNQPIVPQPDPEPQLRQVEVKQFPNKKGFDDVLIGKDKKPDELNGSNKADKMKGRGKSDVLKGSKGNDYLYGDNGKDQLIGGKNADVLQGGKGNDELKGNAGKDILYGDNGDDQLTGGAKRDVFVLSRGKDVITDFKVGTDDIGLVYALDLKLKQKGDNLVMRTSDNIVNTKLLNVNKDDFLKNLDSDDYTLLPFVEVNVL